MLQCQDNFTTTATLNVNDVRLAEAVQRAIRESTGGLIRHLHVEARDSRIVITGQADLFYHKQLATQAVFEALPEATLHNRIEVQP